MQSMPCPAEPQNHLVPIHCASAHSPPRAGGYPSCSAQGWPQFLREVDWERNPTPLLYPHFIIQMAKKGLLTKKSLSSVRARSI